MRLRNPARPTGRVGRGQREAVHEAAASGEDKQAVLGRRSMRLRSHARPTGRVSRGQWAAVDEAAVSGEGEQPVLGFERLSPRSRGQRGSL